MPILNDCMNELLLKIDTFIYKHDGVLNTRHRVLSPNADSDKELVNFVKKKLATSHKNRKFWNKHLNLMVSKLSSWQSNIDLMKEDSIEYHLRKFNDETGFNVDNIKGHIKNAAKYIDHDKGKCLMQLMMAENLINKLITDNFNMETYYTKSSIDDFVVVDPIV